MVIFFFQQYKSKNNYISYFCVSSDVLYIFSIAVFDQLAEAVEYTDCFSAEG